jgi:hypothetical protein
MANLERICIVPSSWLTVGHSFNPLSLGACCCQHWRRVPRQERSEERKKELQQQIQSTKSFGRLLGRVKRGTKNESQFHHHPKVYIILHELNPISSCVVVHSATHSLLVLHCNDDDDYDDD